MQLQDFLYELPEHLIAQSPASPRDHSRLLILDKINETIHEKKFFEILDELGSNDVLVLNHTKVLHARLRGKIDVYPQGVKTEKNVEVFLHKQISTDTWECIGYPGKNLKPGRNIRFLDSKNQIVMNGTIREGVDGGRIIVFDVGGSDFFSLIEKIGEIPLPPYITERNTKESDYQTVFGDTIGSVAAPTAGLHFTEELLERLKKNGVQIEVVLLHVGLGTFKPIECHNILEHKMHSEYIEIEKGVADRLNEYKKKGKRIIAVGTTVVRTLESMTDENGILQAGSRETSIFIYPGYEWKYIDSIITNFHLPASTLLLLVSSFGGIENIKRAYEYAVKNEFRFFSFGDAMWIK